jgi:hypothetical protein
MMNGIGSGQSFTELALPNRVFQKMRQISTCCGILLLNTLWRLAVQNKFIEYAFPCEEWSDSTDPNVVNPIRHKGMTLRDYFAAKVMQTLPAYSWDYNDIANVAYDVADAMLKKRDEELNDD